MLRVLIRRETDPQRTQNSFLAGFFYGDIRTDQGDVETLAFRGKGNRPKGGTQWETKARRIRTRAGNRR